MQWLLTSPNFGCCAPQRLPLQCKFRRGAGQTANHVARKRILQRNTCAPSRQSLGAKVNSGLSPPNGRRRPLKTVYLVHNGYCVEQEPPQIEKESWSHYADWNLVVSQPAGNQCRR